MNYSLFPHPKMVTPEQVPMPDAVFERLIRFWQAQPSVEGQTAIIWKGILALQAFQELEGALKDGNVPKVRHCLEHMYEGELTFGTGRRRTPPDEYRLGWEKWLLQVAVSIGVIPLFNEGQPDPPKVFDPEWIVERIEEELKIQFDWPGRAGGIFGMQVGRRFIPIKFLHELATAAAIVRLGLRYPVIEIGAGAGALAFWLTRARLPYFIVDLPAMAVLQAFQLLSCDALAVNLDGENSGFIHICGLKRPSRLPAIVINENSLPEMPREVEVDYLRWITNILVPGGLFLSINQETSVAGQNSVHSMMKRVGGLKLVSRNIAWYGPDYVQEVYQK